MEKIQEKIKTLKSEDFCLNTEGMEEDETCNREGCNGVMGYKHPDDGSCGCSCTNFPPCDWCTTTVIYCSECDFEVEEYS